MKGLWKLAVAGMVGVGAFTGGVAHASNYPPDDTTATTVVVASGIRAPEAPAPSADEAALAATGSDSGGAVKLGAGSLVAGLGLVLVARRRRRPAAA